MSSESRASSAHAEDGGGPSRRTACSVSGYRAVGMSNEASRSSSGQRWVTTFARV